MRNFFFLLFFLLEIFHFDVKKEKNQILHQIPKSRSQCVKNEANSECFYYSGVIYDNLWGFVGVFSTGLASVSLVFCDFNRTFQLLMPIKLTFHECLWPFVWLHIRWVASEDNFKALNKRGDGRSTWWHCIGFNFHSWNAASLRSRQGFPLSNIHVSTHTTHHNTALSTSSTSAEHVQHRIYNVKYLRVGFFLFLFFSLSEQNPAWTRLYLIGQTSPVPGQNPSFSTALWNYEFMRRNVKWSNTHTRIFIIWGGGGYTLSTLLQPD